MAENKTISENACTSSDLKTNKPLPTRGGVIFVVEAIETEEVNDFESKSKKYDQRLFEPSFKSFYQLIYLVLGYLAIVLMACVVCSIPVSVVPMTNTIIHSWYWWEMIVNGTFFVNALLTTGVTITEMKIIFNLEFSRLLKPFVWSLAYIFLVTSTSWFLCYMFWTVLLENNHPMPFVGYILNICWMLPHYASIWFMFPNEMRKSSLKRRKILAYISYRLWLYSVTVQTIVLNTIRAKLNQAQWIMAIVLPLYREMNIWVLRKIWKKWDNSGDSTFMIFNLTATVAMNLMHAFYVAITISTKVSQLTAICILAVDVFINLYDTYSITKRRKQVSTSGTRKTDKDGLKIDTLTLSGIEMIEFMTPIAYALTFAMAFYGANADLIGGVRFPNWHHTEVKDIGAFLADSGMMFIVDFACAVVSGILLWKTASISMLEEGYKLLRMYWPLISTRMAQAMFIVSLYKS